VAADVEQVDGEVVAPQRAVAEQAAAQPGGGHEAAAYAHGLFNRSGRSGWT
jgi:hypothetical protein